MKQSNATVLGFCAAAAVPAAWASAIAPFGGFSVGSMAVTFIIVGWFSFLATGFLGLPAFLLLDRWNLVTWWSTVLVGSGLGVVVAAVLRLPDHLSPHDLQTMVPLAGASAFAFWLVWRTGR